MNEREQSPPGGDSPSGLLTLGLGRRGCQAVWTPAGAPPVEGELPGARIDAIAREAGALLAPRGGVLLPGDDVDLVRSERQVALLLLAMLRSAGMRTLFEHVLRDLRPAAALQARAPLMLDLRTPALRALPWETLEALGPSDWAGPPLVVVRRPPHPGLGGWEPALSMEVVLWVTDTTDPVCQGVAARLADALSDLRGVCLRPFDGGWAATPGASRVLHIVGHGLARTREVVLAREEGRVLAPDSAARVVGGGSFSLAVLDVCEAGASTLEPGSSPAWQLLEVGVGACVAPQVELSTQSSTIFSSSFYRGLAAGQPPLAAMIAARAALRALGLAHPSCRWWNPMLVAAREAHVTRPLICPPPRLPPGWPAPDRAATAALLRAYTRARAQGWLGAEHLAGALSDVGPGGQLPGEGLLSSEEPPTLPLSPRLRGWASRLKEGFGVQEIARLLAHVGWLRESVGSGAVAWWSAAPQVGVTTLAIDAGPLRSLAPSQPGVVLEVEGGPEDGRVLTLSRETPWLGRWDPERQDPSGCVLFGEGIPTDRGVSRAHLRWVGGARVEVLGRTTLLRGGLSNPAVGALDLAADDRLLLGLATRLRVWAICPGADVDLT